MKLVILVVLFFAATTLASETWPECSWACDNPACGSGCSWSCTDPQCSAECYAQCAAPVCQISCSSKKEAMPKEIDCAPPRCQTQCPPTAGMDVKSSCPMCETVCAPPVCADTGDAECTVLCESTACDWICERPAHCDTPLCHLEGCSTCVSEPACELQCESPACEGTPRVASLAAPSKPTMVVLGFLALVVFITFL